MLTHQAQVRLGELALGPLAALHGAQQQALLGRVADAGVDLLGRDVALLDELGKSTLVLGREQVDLADLAEVEPHRVGRARVDTRRALLASATATARQQPLDVVVVDHHFARRARGGVASSSSSTCTVSSIWIPAWVSAACTACSASPVSSASRSTCATSSAWSSPSARPRRTRASHSDRSTPPMGGGIVGTSAGSTPTVVSLPSSFQPT
jgi:hypothetical protein